MSRKEVDATTLSRIADVIHTTGLARTTIYAKIAAGTFPKPIKISKRASAWVDSEVEEWVRERIAESRDLASA